MELCFAFLISLFCSNCLFKNSDLHTFFTLWEFRVWRGLVLISQGVKSWYQHAERRKLKLRQYIWFKSTKAPNLRRERHLMTSSCWIFMFSRGKRKEKGMLSSPALTFLVGSLQEVKITHLYYQSKSTHLWLWNTSSGNKYKVLVEKDGTIFGFCRIYAVFNTTHKCTTYSETSCTF